ncbi:MAG: YbaB/EbfC DNA-binding family [Actinomycetota bacterium]|jgi:DNA-binding protein YbaB
MKMDPDITRWLDADLDFEAMVREQEEQAERMVALERRLAEAVLMVRSPDRHVTVHATGAGAITGITIDDRAFDELDRSHIAPLVLATVQQAMHEAGEQLRTGLTDVLRDTDFVDQVMRKWPGTSARDDEDADGLSETERLLGHGMSPD